MRLKEIRKGLGIRPLNEMIALSADKFPDRLALRIKDKNTKKYREYTYSSMLSAIRKVGGFLKEHGIKKGNFVGVIGENRPEWMISYFGILWIGGVVVPLDARAKETEIRHIIQHAGVKLIIASSRHLDMIMEIKESCKKPSFKVVVSMDESDEVPNLPDIFREFEDTTPIERVNLEDLAVVLYTSGTTGNSKGVMLTHKNLSSNVDQIYRVIYFDENDRFFSVLPIHHVYENTAGNLLPLSVGASITYARSLKSKILFEDLKDTEPTAFLAVPLLLEKILLGIQRKVEKAPIHKKGFFALLKGGARVINAVSKKKGSEIFFRSLREKMGFGKLRYMISGGAALPVWVSKGLEELGFPLLQGYGLSETSPVLTLNPPCCPKNETAGLPLPDIELKIMEPNENGVGEIAVKGPNVMKGYFKNPEATREVFTDDGFFLTGDLGFLDEDGFLHITGRKKSVIVTKGGKNIFPEEVENVLLQSPFIEEILVLRGFDPDTGAEEVHAIVYPNMEKLDEYFMKKGIDNPTEQDVYEVIRKEIDKYGAALAEYKRVKRFTLRDEEFPKTTTNKIKRYLFEQQHFNKI